MADEKLVRLHNLKELLRARQVEDRERAAYLVKHLGSSVSYWSGMLAGVRSFGERVARRIEEGLGLGRGYLDSDGHTPASAGGAISIAQTMSPSPFDDPPTIELGEKMEWDALPALFKAAMPDDALAPDHPRGLVFVWSKTKTPKPNSIVLVRDRHDRPHVREYHGGIEPGSWTAAATNRAYPALDQASATIVAVAVFRELP